jgi:hypothetical protein
MPMSGLRALWRSASMLPALRPFTRWRVARAWRRSGSPLPPPHVVKQQQLIRFARRTGVRTLVETGTHTGEMVEAMRPYFDRIVSIELLPEFYEQARRRFAGVPSVELLFGDSGEIIPHVLAGLNAPALFWLDGHVTGGKTARGAEDTPIMAELAAVLRHHVRGHVILIDDARLFTGADGYPSIDAVRAAVRSTHPDVPVTVNDDAICCVLSV